MTEFYEPGLIYTGENNIFNTISIKHESVKDLKKLKLQKIKKLNNENLYNLAIWDMFLRVFPMTFGITFLIFFVLNILNAISYSSFNLFEMLTNLIISLLLSLVIGTVLSFFYAYVQNDYYTRHRKENEQIFKNNFGYLLDEPRLVYLLNLTIVERNKQRNEFKISRLYQFLNINASSKNELIFDMPTNYIIYDVKNEINSIKINKANVTHALKSIPFWTGSDILNMLNIIEQLYEKNQRKEESKYIPNIWNMPISQLKQYQEKLKSDYEKYSNDIENITKNNKHTGNIK